MKWNWNYVDNKKEILFYKPITIQWNNKFEKKEIKKFKEMEKNLKTFKNELQKIMKK